MIAMMVCGGFVYAFAFNGFNVEKAIGGEVEAWLADAGGGGSGGEPDPCDCMASYMSPYEDCSSNVCKSNADCDGKASCSSECAQKDYEFGCDNCEVWTDDDGTHNLFCGNEGDKCKDNPESCSPGTDPLDQPAQGM
jgi:hypothetical protein